MKRIITLCLALAAVATVGAQSREEARRVILGQQKGGNGGGTSTQGRDVILGGGNGGQNDRNYPSSSRTEEINREYDQKIWSIRNNPNLSGEEKERIIRQLERDRARRIREAGQSNGRYEDRRNRDDRRDRDDRYGKKEKRDKEWKRDRDDDDDRYEGRRDNGKHKGWYKGKGNQRKGKG